MLLACIVVYALALAALGIFTGRRVRRAREFYVAGRTLSAPLLFSTFLAANLGAGSTVGVAGFAYRDGLSAWWWVASAGIGSIVLGLFVGPRIYRLAAKHNLYTVGDYLELRYGRAVRLATASVLWLGSLSILAAQLIAIGFIFQVVLNLPPAWGAALGGAVVAAYFCAGGLTSTVRVNAVQLGVKAAGFGLAVPWALTHLAGWDEIRAAALSHPAVQAGSYLSWTGIGLEGVLGYAVVLIPSFIVSPGLLQKLYGARNETTIRRGVAGQGLALLLYSVLPVLLGMIALAQFPELENPEMALPVLLAKSFPVWLGGLMLAAIFSAEVSSADAVLFMLSTSVARDLVESLRKRPLGDRSLLRVTRAVALAGAAGGVGLAIWLQSIIQALMVFYSLLVVMLFVPLLAGLYSSRPKAGAALASMAVSVPATVVFHVETGGAGIGILNPTALGILVSGLVLVSFSIPAAGKPAAGKPAAGKTSV